MRRSVLSVERTGHAVVQDLGRPGHTHIGIPGNGAADQFSARVANLLVGNAADAPLIEITGSELTMVAHAEVLLAVTGAADEILLDGASQPAPEAVLVHRGARVQIPAGQYGLRSYVAINGRIEADSWLGSVAPDHLLGVGRRLAPGDEVAVRTEYTAYPSGQEAPLFRLAAPRLPLGGVTHVQATPGPELDRMALGAASLAAVWTVSPQSDHIGLRLLGPAIEQTSSTEVLSRGVPVGAIQVPPAGGIIILLRGRLVTAGYPIVGVVTTASLSGLGQVRPGDTIEIAFTDLPAAQAALQAQQTHLNMLATRMRTAFRAAGLARILDQS